MIEIKVIKGDINKALKKYKSKVIKTKQLRKLNDRKEYTKPTQVKREKMKKAKYINKKNRED